MFTTISHACVHHVLISKPSSPCVKKSSLCCPDSSTFLCITAVALLSSVLGNSAWDRIVHANAHARKEGMWMPCAQKHMEFWMQNGCCSCLSHVNKNWYESKTLKKHFFSNLIKLHSHFSSCMPTDRRTERFLRERNIMLFLFYLSKLIYSSTFIYFSNIKKWNLKF